MKLYLDLGDIEIVEIEAEYDFTPETQDYFDPAEGLGQPGDSEIINITKITVPVLNCTIPVKMLTESAYEKLCDQISNYENRRM